MTQSLLVGPQCRYVLCRGVGEARRALNAIDAALLEAGVGHYNLLKVSSILPPAARPAETVELAPGSCLPTAYALETAEEAGRHISAAVAVAVPRDPERPGLIMESHGAGNAEEAERVVREMAAEGLERRGIELDHIRSTATDALSGDRPTAVFAGLALLP
jgi:arginine decarboxylase